jgi:hypothetical protein
MMPQRACRVNLGCRRGAVSPGEDNGEQAAEMAGSMAARYIP